jgi:hypothetical protein
MPRRDRVLSWYLRAYAVALLAALPATVAPTSALAAAHESLGLGPWPDLPLLEYLARSASAVYASLGGVALLASFDVQRHRPFVLFLGLLSLSGAVYLVGMGLAVKMPLWWIAVEGTTVLLSAIPLLVLGRPSPPRPRPLSPPDGAEASLQEERRR